MLKVKDYIVRASAGEGTVRAFAAVTTNLVREAKRIHHLSPLAAAALGRTMTAAAIMSLQLKGSKDTLTIQIKGDGPIGGIVVVSDANANVRGYVHNPQVYLPLNSAGKFDVAGAVGKGYLNVIKDLGLKEPYIGYVNLVSGEIAEDITYYFAHSEQVPSAVALGVLVAPDEEILSAGGYIIQLMPDVSENTIEYIEKKLQSIPPISSLLSEGKNPEYVLELLLGEIGLKVLGEHECAYKCNCSRERIERNILCLGEKEIKNMIEELGEIEAQCHFCNRKYKFSADELLK